VNVLVIPEDFRKDQFIVQPIITAMFTKLGRPAIVEVLKDPLVGGIARALDRELLGEVVEMNQWKVDLFLLCVDRDGEVTRRAALDQLERHFAGLIGPGKFFASENAWQELEVWLLAGQELPAAWDWQDVRRERDPKEVYFVKLAARRGLQDDPGGGRKTMGIEAARKYRRIHSRCREDIQVLEKRLARWMENRTILSWEEAYRTLGERGP
jgi:hypothetical protein